MATLRTATSASGRRPASGWTFAWKTKLPELPSLRPRRSRDLVTLALLLLAITGVVLVWRHEHPNPFRRTGSYEPPGLLATFAGSLVVRATLVSDGETGQTDGPLLVRRLADWEIRAELLEAAPQRIVVRLHDVRRPWELLRWALRRGHWRVHLLSTDQKLPVSVLDGVNQEQGGAQVPELRRPLAQYSAISCRALRPLRERIARLLGRTSGCRCDGPCVVVLVDDPPILTESDLERAFLLDQEREAGVFYNSRGVMALGDRPMLRFYVNRQNQAREQFAQGYAAKQPWVDLHDGELYDFAVHVGGARITTILHDASLARAWSEISALESGPLGASWRPISLVHEATQQPLEPEPAERRAWPESRYDGFYD